MAALRRARGIRGELVAENLGSDPERFAAGLKASLVADLATDRAKPVEVERAWWQNGDLVLKFCGIDTRNDAEALRGWFLCVREEERPPLAEGEFYLSELIGCRVVTAGDHRELGVVTGFQDVGGPVILEIGDDLLIPYVPQICREVELEERRILVELPEGLEDLNRK